MAAGAALFRAYRVVVLFCCDFVIIKPTTETSFDFEKDQAESKQEIPSIKDTNFMQRDLILRSGREPPEWIKEQSGDFRLLINARPELFCGYADLPEEEKTRRLESVEVELGSVGRQKAA